ncbi:MAG: twin-arginine translocase TatA/TatE family subunit [Dysgonamonadaceae bacterium]|jgi:sec-independent protein translocase protein TatA|nr:twin-arginine translocase TatA/TatE family subunit [Dysgonamonadaceae bacterium]
MNSLLFLQNLNGWEWVFILAAILLLFGGKKIPELMKGIGKGIRGFKDGMKGIEEDINSDEKSK